MYLKRTVLFFKLIYIVALDDSFDSLHYVKFLSY
jgi:hypothetical protein